jgi:hypothetical protein
MTPLDFHARVAANEELIGRVSALLAEHWDPEARFRAPNGACDPSSHARAVLGILAAGGPAAQVMGYLRYAEEELLGAAVSNGQLRGAIANRIWAWSWEQEPMPGEPGSIIPSRNTAGA